MGDNINKLTSYLKGSAQDGRIAIAYSGGVDSTVLLKIAKLSGLDVLAVTFNTQLTSSMGNIETAERMAREMDAKQVTLQIDALSIPEIRANCRLRCYYCKRSMMVMLKEYAASHGYHTLADGTNTDDRKQYRPGLKALDEAGVISPIAACGLSKADVRAIASELGMEVAVKPSAPCLLTRFPYDTQVTDEMLSSVEKWEGVLKSAGFKNCRMRVHGSIARIEIPESDFAEFIQRRKDIITALKELGAAYITLDIEGLRSGSMDEKR